MSRVCSYLGLSFTLACTFSAQGGEAPLRAVGLRCEYRVNPVGLDVTQPRLSWRLDSDQRGQRQSAYHVLVASSPAALARGEGDLWDTGKIASDESLHLVYAGQPLRSRRTAHWKVRVWDRDDQPSDWSEAASWTMGLLAPSDWQAKWIADAASVITNAAAQPHNGYHSQFASNANTAKWVMVGLRKPEPFAAVRLVPARPYDWQPDTPGFLFPLRFRIEVADRSDFADGRVVLDRTQADEPNPGTNAPLYRFAATRAHFIRLQVTGLRERDAGHFGFALAELELLDGTNNIARGAMVSALDSIETGAWSATNLVDGVLGPVRPSGGTPALPATMVRQTFTVSGPVRRATAYTSALGLYELRLNGQRVGDQLLAPEWTSYRRRVQYQTHDVTQLLREGPNAAAAWLGEGWYAGRLMAVGRFAYGVAPRFLLQLELELADGRRQVVVTDDAWRSTTDGPIRSAGIYDGEVYDARREFRGWDEAAFDDRAWMPVRTFELGTPRLVWPRNEPIQVVQELTPMALAEPKPGVYVFDLGQNMVGWCRLQAVGRAGQAITLRHAEMLNDDGTLYTANLRGAPQVDRYVPRVDGGWVFEPRFTYHGFRYVEVTGLAEPPGTNSLIGRVFHSTAPVVSRCECSDPSLNRLLRNILWTQRANLMSSPNDCPQRDERFGWMGDIQAFAQTAIFNMDLAAFFTKFAQDIRDDQADDGRFPDFAPHPGNPNLAFSGAPAWADAGTIVPWRVYQNYADRRLLEEHFESARRWVNAVHRRNPDLIWAQGRQNDYNDWLNGDWIRQQGWPAQGGSVPKELFATAFFAHSTDLVAAMAERIGRPADARQYRELFRRIGGAFRQRFGTSDGRLEGDTQAGYALALCFGLLPDDQRPTAARHLVEAIHRYGDRLSTGIQTTHRAMLVLPQHGYTDLAWQLLTNRTFPSWLYMIDNGATTVWERWDGYVRGRGFQDPGMNSFNHWAFGAVGEWMWRYLVGLNPDDAHPGWKQFLIAPSPGGGVTWARGEYDSIRGRIVSAWRLDREAFTLRVTIPANTTATVLLPGRDPAGLREGGRALRDAEGVRIVGRQAGRVVLAVASGSYDFAVPRREYSE